MVNGVAAWLSGRCRSASAGEDAMGAQPVSGDPAGQFVRRDDAPGGVSAGVAYVVVDAISANQDELLGTVRSHRDAYRIARRTFVIQINRAINVEFGELTSLMSGSGHRPSPEFFFEARSLARRLARGSLGL
jgi:hypothetical protein